MAANKSTGSLSRLAELVASLLGLAFVSASLRQKPPCAALRARSLCLRHPASSPFGSYAGRSLGLSSLLIAVARPSAKPRVEPVIERRPNNGHYVPAER